MIDISTLLLWLW